MIPVPIIFTYNYNMLLMYLDIFYLSSFKASTIDFCFLEKTLKKLSAFKAAVLWYSNDECLLKTFYKKLNILICINTLYYCVYNYVCNIKIKFKIINKITSLAFFQLLNGSEDKIPSF